MTERRRYLGDAVYVGLTDGTIELTTEDGVRATNRIILEPEVVVAFIDWVQRAHNDGVFTPRRAASRDPLSRSAAGDPLSGSEP